MAKEKDVTEILDWAIVMAKSSPEYRKEMVREVLESLKDFSEKGENNSDKSAGMNLFKEFSDPDDYEIIGFTPNVQYIKEKARSKEELEALFVHPWGSHTLLLKHRRYPFMVMVNPGIRLGKSYLKEMPKSVHAAEDVDGLTG